MNKHQDTLPITKQFAFKTLTISDGLSQNSVISIAQDSIGYLWLATQDGLNKYDGRSFTHYNKQFEDITRTTFSKLGKIYIDKQNRLWIITHSGKLEIYQPENDSFKHIKLPYNTSSIYQDKNLNLYIGTYDKGLFKIDYRSKDTLQIFQTRDRYRTVYDYIETDDGLIVTCSGAIYLYNGNTYKALTVESRLNTNFSSIQKTPNGNLWIGTYGAGLFYKPYNTDNITRFEHDKLPHNLNIEDLLVDSKDRLWIATYGNGVYLMDLKSKKITNFKANKNDPFAIHYNDMLCLYEDTTGIIWFGSDGTGASYYDEHLIKFNILTNNQVPKSVNVDMVRSITTDKEGNIWIGTSGMGLTYVDIKNKNYKTFTSNNSQLNSSRIISLNYFDNELWTGHQGYGLNSMDISGNFKSYPKCNNFTIWRIVEETKNSRWLCTERYGIILFDKDKGFIKRYSKENSALTSNNVRALVKENDSILWIGTDNDGVFKLNKNTNKISKINGLHYKVKSLLYTNNILWVGTNGTGIKKFDIIKNTVQTYTQKDGLANDVIYGILPDGNGVLWLSTNKGITRFDNTSTNKSFENFSFYDGLQGSEFNTGAYFKDSKGTLYFGGLEGINWFNPEQLTYNTVKPRTVITKLEVFSNGRPLSNDLELKYDQNTVTFTFSSLHFSQPERNFFKYQLVNHDNDWIESKNKNIAHYTNLPPNNYTFKVISSNYDGVWSEMPTTYSFTIKQPWYFSSGAIIIYALLFLITSYSIYYYLKWRWHIKMQLKFEHKETKRLKKLDKLKTRLYTNLSHEFRTPLTLITGPVEKQLNNPSLTNEDKQDLILVQRNSKRLLGLVDQLLDLSKLETGNLNLSVSKGNLSVLLKQIIAGFIYKAEEKDIAFTFKIVPMPQAWFDKDVIEKIVTNLLSNAIKYTLKQGKIHFESTTHQDQVIITTVNNGNTLKNSEIGKLFKRFYQSNKNTDGVGIGLSLVKELVTLSHGNIVAHTINNDEIQFTVTLPIERSLFNTSEINDHSNERVDKEEINTPLSFVDSTDTTNGTKKYLLQIVEDDKDIRQFIRSILKEEYNIIESSNGKQGIKKALKHIPDIIISDIMMPKTDGIQLCKTLKNDERTSHIPIILLTAKSGDKNEIEGLKTGADDYIIKPFNSEKIKVRIQKLIELRHNLQKRYGNAYELNDVINSKPDQQFLFRLKKILDSHITQTILMQHY
ncbi:hybrid sensor histidine kinase/response regulator [Snuella lapsa]|uniref:hybrid sensor histidine kinase/response regulator n=1 Tax=Snuella lapsa TaxID=870481 RepID=UPI0031ECB33C